VRKPDVDLGVLHGLLRRVFSGTTPFRAERAVTGGSTQVYRIVRGGETFYLRVAEARAASLAPEALAHRLLRERGVSVPAVVHFEPFDAALDRSVMITAEIPGEALGRVSPGIDLRPILAAAGRDLARLNGVPVEGFDWIRRDDPESAVLRGELPGLRAFALGRLDGQLARVRERYLSGEEIRWVARAVVRHEALLDLDAPVGRLAHGDLDVGHIFQRDGVYTGLIDLGEIRGAEPTYDLGHFALHDGETLPVVGLPHLLAGYREIAPLPADHEARIHLSAVLIGIRALARFAGRPPALYHAVLARAVRRSLRVLLA
jgi:aminoglycoside phosphotransferase (APT) family kinase protein